MRSGNDHNSIGQIFIRLRRNTPQRTVAQACTSAEAATGAHAKADGASATCCGEFHFFENLTGSRPGAEIPRRSSSDPSCR